jgi:hypothetical protein
MFDNLLYSVISSASYGRHILFAKCMKTKNKRKNNSKTRKGGHKVHYNYKGNIESGTNKPLTGRHVHENNCLACAMYSLGYMTKDTARYLQRESPEGVTHDVVLDMVNNTYGPGHTFKIYDNPESIKEYLQPEEATLGYFERLTSDLGHYFIVFCSKKGKLFVIDSQQHVVVPMTKYIEHYNPIIIHLLTEPDIKPRPRYKFITTEIINNAFTNEKTRYKLEHKEELPETDDELPDDKKLEERYASLLEISEPKIPQRGIHAFDDMFLDTPIQNRYNFIDE